MEVHHAGERRGEAHAVGDGAVAVQPHHLVLLSHVVQETAIGQGDVMRLRGTPIKPSFLGEEGKSSFPAKSYASFRDM